MSITRRETIRQKEVAPDSMSPELFVRYRFDAERFFICFFVRFDQKYILIPRWRESLFMKYQSEKLPLPSLKRCALLGLTD